MDEGSGNLLHYTALDQNFVDFLTCRDLDLCWGAILTDKEKLGVCCQPHTHSGLDAPVPVALPGYGNGGAPCGEKLVLILFALFGFVGFWDRDREKSGTC